MAAYNSVPRGDADRCACFSCRNFAVQRGGIYPPAFLALLDQLGIDPMKEGEVFDAAGVEDGRKLRHTGGWFHFVGELVEKGEKLAQAGAFQYWFQPSFPRPRAAFGDRVAAIEFSTQIPWVLDENPSG